MKIKRNEKCICGSGRKYKNCCLHSTQHDTSKTESTTFEEVTLLYGFTQEYATANPFEVDFDNPCCLVIKADEESVAHFNKLLSYNILSLGDWFVVGYVDGQQKTSFRFDTADEAMEVGKEKFSAVRFLSLPEFI
jgi:hypothetical protein